MDSRIILLDEGTANQIAAGEVVERPSAVVKELVENAIDAGATQIMVWLEQGGKQLIRVSDNGCGMTHEEAVLAIQRHATSKLRDAGDLFSIRTLGFRGEALPSIASVSHFDLVTQPNPSLWPVSVDEIGTQLQVVGGILERIEQTAARPGTTVTVTQLFFNTPARLKFLKSQVAELGRSLDAAGNLSLAYPGIAFRVEHEGRCLLKTAGDGQPLGPFVEVWGREIARHLIPIEREEPSIRITGYVAEPSTTRNDRTHELFFVNRRPVRNRMLANALEQAMRALTPESRFPIAAIFIEIAPDMVDVNVHPTKNEVKFTREGEVHHAVSEAVKGSLLRQGLMPRFESAQLSSSTFSQNAPSGSDPPRAFSFPSQAVDASRFEPFQQRLEQRFGRPEGEPESQGQQPTQAEAGLELLRNGTVLGQLSLTYIVVATEAGLAIVDQHVAHERVIYERLSRERSAGGPARQSLAIPQTIHLSRREAILLNERLSDFLELGWRLEPFGPEDYLVRAVPAYAGKRGVEELLREMVDELVNQSISRRLLVHREHVTITNACKMAVKAGDRLEKQEMEALISQLLDTENRYFCPHGRPIVVLLGQEEIDRKFKRA